MSPDSAFPADWRDTDGPLNITIVGRSNLVIVQVSDHNRFALVPGLPGRRPSNIDNDLIGAIKRKGLVRVTGGESRIEMPAANETNPDAVVRIVVPRDSVVHLESRRGNVRFDGRILPETQAKRRQDRLPPITLHLTARAGLPSVQGLNGTLIATTMGNAELHAEVFGEARLQPSETSTATVTGSGKRLCNPLSPDSHVVLRPGDLDVSVQAESQGTTRVRPAWDGRDPNIDKGTVLTPGQRFHVDPDGSVFTLVPNSQLSSALGAGLEATADKGAGHHQARPATTTSTARAPEIGGQAI